MRKLTIKTSIFQDNNSFIVFFILFPIFMEFFNQTTRFFVSNTHRIDTLFCYALLIGLFLCAQRKIIKEFKGKWVLISLIWICLLSTSTLTSPDSSLNIEVIIYSIERCIPAFIVSTLISDTDRLWKGLKIIAVLILIMIIIETYVVKAEGFLLEYDSKNQYASYQAMISATIFVIALFESFSWKTVFALIVNMFVLLTFGERTPFFIVLVLLLVMILFTEKNARASRRKMAFLGASIVFLIFVLLFSEEIIAVLISLMGEVNMSSRMTEFLLQQRSVTADAGRGLIYSESLNILKDNWIVGVGFINERFLLYHSIHWTISTVHGMYPHNIVLEILVQTGVFIGSAAVILLCKIMIKTYKLCRAKKTALFVYMFFFFNGLFPLIASGSYINWIYFYYFMGFCVAILSKKQRVIKN